MKSRPVGPTVPEAITLLPGLLPETASCLLHGWLRGRLPGLTSVVTRRFSGQAAAGCEAKAARVFGLVRVHMCAQSLR